MSVPLLLVVEGLGNDALRLLHGLQLVHQAVIMAEVVAQQTVVELRAVDLRRRVLRPVASSCHSYRAVGNMGGVDKTVSFDCII